MDERITISTCPHCKLTFGDINDLFMKNADKILNQNLTCSATCDKPYEKLWLCLDCGFIGCGHYDNQHSTEHYKSTGHSIFMNLAQLGVWCFSCNAFVNVEKFIDWAARKKKELGRKMSLGSPLTQVSVTQSDVPQQVTQLRQKQSLELNLVGQVPILNNNATCYAASVLQCLAHLPYFAKWFWALAPYLQQGTYNSEQQCLQDIFSTHFSQMMQVLQLPADINQIQCHFKSEQVSLEPFYRALQANFKQFIGDKQQDAQEFLQCTFEACRSSYQRRFPRRLQSDFQQSDYLSQFTNRQRDIISDCFSTYYIIQKQYKCKNCDFSQATQELTENSFISLNVSQNQTDLRSSFQKFFSQQDTDITCQKCNQQSVLSQQLKIFQPAPCLILHLLCFQANGEKAHTNFTLSQLQSISMTQFLYNSSNNQFLSSQLNQEELSLLYRSMVSQYMAQLTLQCFYNRSKNKSHNQQAYDQLIQVLYLYIFNLSESHSSVVKLAQKYKFPLKIALKQAENQQQKINYFLEIIANEYYDIAKYGNAQQDFLTELTSDLKGLKNSKLFKQTVTLHELQQGICEYDLQAAVLHSGDLMSGHYTAITRKDDDWLIFDNEQIKTCKSADLNVKEPYLLFYQQKRSNLQDQIINDIYQQLYQQLNNQPYHCQKLLVELYNDYFQQAQFYTMQFGQELKLCDSNQSFLSGDFLYRLHQLPWPMEPNLELLDITYHQYAVQPSMVPCRVPINNLLLFLYESVFGSSRSENSQFIADQKKQSQEDAQNLLDQLLEDQFTENQPRFAVSKQFVRQLSDFCFQDREKPKYCNGDLIKPGEPLNRFKLIDGLELDADYVTVGMDVWQQIKKKFGGLEIQMWQKTNIYGMPEQIE